jgi:hypothetical protein
MSPEIKVWFDEAIRRGVKAQAAWMGTELIGAFENFWHFKISEQDREKMIEFALQNPAAAVHRWNLVGRPRPWLPQESEMLELKKNPRYSMLDDLERQSGPLGKPGFFRRVRRWFRRRRIRRSP